MVRTSPAWLLACVAVAACTNSGSGVEAGDSVGTSEDTGESTEGSGTTDADTETDTGSTDTGDTDTGGEPLVFVAAGSYEAVLLAVDLTHPHDVPPADIIALGSNLAGLFGPTPFGSEAVTHEGSIDQLRLTDGELSLSLLATQAGNWLNSVWFGDAGANALITTSPDPISSPDTLLWVRYDDNGKVTTSWDLTPPKQPAGSVLILGRSPDSRWAVAAVDDEPNGSWDLYVLPIDVDPAATVYIDTVNLAGIAPVDVADFLSLEIDDQRAVYRRLQLGTILRPVAVDLHDPEATPISIGTSLGHTYSITSARADASRLLVTNGGTEDDHELRLIELDGPTTAQAPVLITQPGELAREHGFDGLGRIHYVYGDGSESTAIALVTATAGEVTERLELAGIPAGAAIDDVVFDAELDLLAYRVHTTNQSWVSYLDLSADQPTAIRIDQDFTYSASDPGPNVRHGWSANGDRIALVGVQAGQTTLYVAELGDVSGATVKIELPDVGGEYAFDDRPMVSPEGDQIMVWYGSEAGRKGLIHALADGSSTAQVVVWPHYSLSSGTYLK